MSESKVTTAHRGRVAVVYVRQSTPAQVEQQHRVHRPAVRPGRAGGAAGLAPGRGADHRRRPRRVSGASTAGSFRVRRADHPGRPGSGGNRSGAGGFPARPEQLRLVPAAGPGRDDEHAARRRRRRLPSGVVQRPDAAGPEGNHVGSRTARAAGPPGRRDTQQGRNAGNCAAGCRSGWSGARTRARSCCTPTRPSPG